jgi:DNA-binding transcriptional ArsR family regulator
MDNEQSDVPSLTSKEAVILELMLASAARELFGLEMVEASGGLLKRGTIYVTLKRLEEKGLVESRPEVRPSPEIGIARRMYRSTGAGALAFDAHRERYRVFATSLLPSTAGG